jgi:DNA-binding NarL/FixJ family response regulator
VLEHCRQFEVVGEAGDGQASIQMADVLQPDLVLLDLSMPLVDGASALHGIRDVAPMATVIIVSGMNPQLGISLIDTGAVGFVPKGLPPLELLERLGSILERELTVECRDSWEAILTEHRAVVFSSDSATRHLVTQVLERCGVIVSAETDTAPTMLEVVELSQPEVIVIDLSVDGMPNTSFISELRTRSPRSAVIVYSAFEIWKDRALAAGAAAFVPEPRVDELADQIRGLMLTS